ncbi:MAG: hypothetical protein PUB10_10270 [Clostridiales bacterium]|nr:hypothetical protein [Clostridiales bacterium]
MKYNKFQRILALLGVILLVSLYLVTLIAALTTSPSSNGFFMASLFSTVAIPVFLYAMNLVYQLLTKKKTDSDEERN